MGNKKEKENKKEIEIEGKHGHFLRTLFFFIILIIALAIVYGRYVGTKIIFINEYEIKNSKIQLKFIQ